jgi:uncharacterized protein (TIGR00369 family)
MEDLKAHPIVQQYIAWNAFGDLLGMNFTIPRKGEVIYTMKIEKMHLATPVAAHGGAIAGLLDAALGVSCLSAVCEEGRIVSTVSLNVNYLSPAKLGDELVAHAKVVKAGRRIIYTECELSNDSGELIARASATMNAYPVEKVAR